MEIDVTHMVDDADNMIELSGSQLEHGKDASKITWSNSLAYASGHPLLTTDEMRDAAREHFRQYGAWSQEEIAAWSESELLLPRFAKWRWPRITMTTRSFARLAHARVACQKATMGAGTATSARRGGHIGYTAVSV